MIAVHETFESFENCLPYKGALRSGKIIYVGVKERQTPPHNFVAK